MSGADDEPEGLAGELARGLWQSPSAANEGSEAPSADSPPPDAVAASEPQRDDEGRAEARPVIEPVARVIPAVAQAIADELLVAAGVTVAAALSEVRQARGETVARARSATPAVAPPPTRVEAVATIVASTGESVLLRVGQAVVVGRTGGPQRLQVPMPEVSSGHLQLEFSLDGLTVVDLHSTNGTALVSGGSTVSLVPGVPHRLSAGDVLEIDDGGPRLCEVLSLEGVPT